MALTFEQKLVNYADLVVRVGLNLQKGQRLLIRAAVESAPFTRRVVEQAYRAGSPFVDVVWNDDALALARFEHASDESFDLFPTWQRDAHLAAAARGDAVLSVVATDPELLKDQDPDKVARVRRLSQTEMRPFSEHIMNSDVSWCVVDVPIASWAGRVFGRGSPGEQVERLWEEIFRAVRADQPDPVGAWQRHLETLEARCSYLNAKAYRELRYHAPGTDLRVGLVEGHVWRGGSESNKDGVVFVPNLPTEEVFTMPHRGRVDGTVRNSLPLSYSGSLIDGFELTFEDGAVVDFDARQGRDTLARLLEADEGAKRLGEVALVPNSSPISKSGILFYSTLYDENASSHLALGRAYRFNLRGGVEMSEEEATEHGVNDSLTHVDFMIGSKDMAIDGVTSSGEVEPVMRGGEWAF